MTRFKIPEKYKKGFNNYIALSAKVKNELLKNIEAAPLDILSSEQSELVTYLVNKVDVNEEELGDIIGSIFSLFNLQESIEELGLQNFVNEIINALKDAKIEVPPDLAQYLFKLLSINSVSLVKKATELALDRQNILKSTRIITDIRPVFGLKKDDEMESVTVVHNIRIEYANRDSLFETNRVYFALDSKDLKKLGEDIKRAEKKEKAIKEKLSTVISFIDIK